MFFNDDEIMKRIDKVEKIARKANRRSAFILVMTAAFLGAIVACDEVTFKRREKEGA